MITQLDATYTISYFNYVENRVCATAHVECTDNYYDYIWLRNYDGLISLSGPTFAVVHIINTFNFTATDWVKPVLLIYKCNIELLITLSIPFPNFIDGLKMRFWTMLLVLALIYAAANGCRFMDVPTET